MKSNYQFLFSTIFLASTMFSTNNTIESKAAHILNKKINKSSINLALESDIDIYGVQFDLKYNPNEIILDESDIYSKVNGIKTYSRLKENGLVRILMFGMNGEKVLDINSSSISDILDINFKPIDMFNGSSQIELIDVTLAGKGGEEVSVSTSIFEVSFNTPIRTALSKNYPNPFNPSTNISYQLSNPGLVTMVIYDIKGSEIKTLVQEYQDANYYNIVWNGLNNNGQAVASGRYLLKMFGPDGFSESITMTLIK